MQIKRIAWLVILILIKGVAFAQDTVMVMRPSMSEDVEEIYPAKWQGWYFKQGSDTAWAAKNLDMQGWKKMRPVDLSVKMADANGKVEGWFRTTVKIDSSFGETPISILFGPWAAQDLYIDGKKVASAGNTGSNGLPYAENIQYDRKNLIIPELKAGTTHAIAWHITDSRGVPFNGDKLKGASRGLHNLLEFVSSGFFKWQGERNQFIGQIYSGIISSQLVLMLLFWLLWGLNRKEKNLFQFALFITFLGMYFITANITGNFYFSLRYPYAINQWRGLIVNVFISLVVGYTPYILALIFSHPFEKRLPVFIVASVLVMLVNTIFLKESMVGTVLIVVSLLISIYIVIASLKKAKGGDWAVIAGVFLTIVFILLKSQLPNNVYVYKKSMYYTAGFALSFPMVLLVYVATRFREMMADSRANAEHVIKLSNEKRVLAEQQQQLLEQEVARQTVELRNSLQHLKATQGQLIQSEKMASLGVLTAGIAHEIQNPLNFVNNFSEVSSELVDEMNEEIQKGNLADVQQIASDLKENLAKINHHGKRAGDIVKGMLQHSRNSNGQKEPADINKLADEYLRLTYHGLLAKDKSFTATIKTDFDASIGSINIIPQDIGRVILNLITNAFYVVDEKKKQLGEGFEPTVSVSTKRNNDNIEILVKDNGNGIPQKIVDKIFQPFFTTKPTGQGTGLGLSLSYDIVKAHGGTLTVMTKEGEWTEFIIALPLNQ